MNTQKLSKPEIRAAYKDGKSIRGIMAATGYTYHYVYYHLKSAGVLRIKRIPMKLSKSSETNLRKLEMPPPFTGYKELYEGKENEYRRKAMDKLHDLHSRAKYKYNAPKQFLDDIIKILEPLENEFLPFQDILTIRC